MLRAAGDFECDGGVAAVVSNPQGDVAGLGEHAVQRKVVFFGNAVLHLVLVGGIDKSYLVNLVEKVEDIIDRKIRYVIFDGDEPIDWTYFTCEPILIWTKNEENE